MQPSQDSAPFPVPADDFTPPDRDARDRRWPVPWEWWDAIVIYFLWIFTAGALAITIAGAFADPESDEATAAGVLAAVAVLIGTALLWTNVRGQRAGVSDAVRRVFGPKRPTAADWGAGVAWGVGAFVVIQLGFGALIGALIEVLGREVPAVQESVQEAVRAGGTTPILITLGVVVLGPLSEEILYRGVLYQALAKHLPGWPAIGLSALAFGLTHVEPLVVVLTFPLGMLLAWLVRRRGTIVTAVVAHSVFNLIGAVLIRVTG